MKTVRHASLQDVGHVSIELAVLAAQGCGRDDHSGLDLAKMAYNLPYPDLLEAEVGNAALPGRHVIAYDPSWVDRQCWSRGSHTRGRGSHTPARAAMRRV